jgi:hypothetical protein
MGAAIAATTYAEAVRKTDAGADHKAASDTQAGVPAPFWAAAGFAGPIVRRPPAQDLGAGPVEIPSRVGIPSGRLPRSGIVLTGWWRLIAHGFLSPLARLRCRVTK